MSVKRDLVEAGRIELPSKIAVSEASTSVSSTFVFDLLLSARLAEEGLVWFIERSGPQTVVLTRSGFGYARS